MLFKKRHEMEKAMDLRGVRRGIGNEYDKNKLYTCCLRKVFQGRYNIYVYSPQLGNL